jgi:hypothetical protein
MVDSRKDRTIFSSSLASHVGAETDRAHARYCLVYLASDSISSDSRVRSGEITLTPVPLFVGPPFFSTGCKIGAPRQSPG